MKLQIDAEKLSVAMKHLRLALQDEEWFGDDWISVGEDIEMNIYSDGLRKVNVDLRLIVGGKIQDMPLISLL